ncbi:MAG: hypothetical protein ACOCQI_03775 [Desulfosalsimonas sp.]
MNRIKMSFIDNDFRVQAAADIEISESETGKLTDFISQLAEDLGTGQTAWLQIDGLSRPVTLSVAESA